MFSISPASLSLKLSMKKKSLPLLICFHSKVRRSLVLLPAFHLHSHPWCLPLFHRRPHTSHLIGSLGRFMISGSVSGLMGFTVESPITAKRKFSMPQVGIARLCFDSLIKTSERCEKKNGQENQICRVRERERMGGNPASCVSIGCSNATSKETQFHAMDALMSMALQGINYIIAVRLYSAQAQESTYRGGFAASKSHTQFP